MEENLKGLVKSFYDDKKQLDRYKKSTEEYNKEIKEGFKELGIEELESDNLIAKVSVSKTESFDEEMLLTKLKELGATDVIRTKEYVDIDLLEDAIYNGDLDASKLSNCRISKEIVKLTVKEKK